MGIVKQQPPGSDQEYGDNDLGAGADSGEEWTPYPDPGSVCEVLCRDSLLLIPKEEHENVPIRNKRYPTRLRSANRPPPSLKRIQMQTAFKSKGMNKAKKFKCPLCVGRSE